MPVEAGVKSFPGQSLEIALKTLGITGQKHRKMCDRQCQGGGEGITMTLAEEGGAVVKPLGRFFGSITMSPDILFCSSHNYYSH